MGTYDASLIRVAGKNHECADCHSRILKGDRYLAYKPGLHSTHKVCMACALRLGRDSCAPIYRCRDVEQEIALRAAKEKMDLDRGIRSGFQANTKVDAK